MIQLKKCLFKVVYDNTSGRSIYNQAYYAYLLIFDANNRKERKEQLQTIIQSSYVSYLFCKNCNPNEFEQQTAFESIIFDINTCYLFMKDCNPTPQQRKEAIEVILNDDDFSFKTIRDCELTPDERQLIHNKFHQKWANTDNVSEFYDYCEQCFDFISESEVEKLVFLIISEQNIEYASKLLDSSIILSDCLKDKLESLFIMQKLNEST